MRRRPRGLRKVANPRQATARTQIFAAPVRGWFANENLSAATPGSALGLVNWFPKQTGVEVRGGCLKRATISIGPVTSMWAYKSGSTEEFFAADAANIFDVTTVVDPDTIPTAAVSGQTSGYYSTQQIGTAGGDFLYAVNGTDSPQLYDGTTFTAITNVSTPNAITGVDPSTFSNVWLYASRLFFVESSTMRAWYLAPDAISGAANSVSLAGVFQEGGSLLFGATWSTDSGSGLDDLCMFFSTEGEVAVYRGTNPNNAPTDWSLVGVYSITKPLGMKGIMKAGGDLLVATTDGIVPMSEALRKDVAALSLAAVTRAIEPEWTAEVARRSGLPWEVVKWDSKNRAVVSLPVTDATQENACFVVNTETGAWTKYVGWQTRSMAIWQDTAYFGTNDGKIYQMESTGSDDGMPYTASIVWQFDHLRTPDEVKIVHNARTTFRAGTDINVQASISVDYSVNLPAAPASVADYASSQWDSARWDQAIWDGGEEPETKNQWHSIGQSGFVIAPQLQITSGVTPKPNIELVSMTITYEPGGIIV